MIERVPLEDHPFPGVEFLDDVAGHLSAGLAARHGERERGLLYENRPGDLPGGAYVYTQQLEI